VVRGLQARIGRAACDSEPEQVVERVDERRQPKPAKQVSEGPRQLQLGEEHDPSALVTGNRRSVAEDEPPALAASFLGDGGEQLFGLVVSERKQGQLLAAVERGDDPRRPAAELSAARVEQGGALKKVGHRDPGVRVTRHAGNDP
jgi:hypothetical protein